jgi:hypothetical protein
MRIDCKTFWLPKFGNEVDDYEDAFAPTEIVQGELTKFRCAVADGATESSFAGLWAKLLAEGHVEEKPLADLRSFFNLQIESKNLSWFAEAKADLGAFAAIIGLQLEAEGRWHAQATGDSCLFHVREKKALAWFPLQKSEEFNNSPVLLSSKESDKIGVESQVSGAWQAGDIFFLVSDALSRWIMLNIERQNQAIFERLTSLNDSTELDVMAQAERQSIEVDGRPILRNDDLTLMRVNVSN